MNKKPIEKAPYILIVEDEDDHARLISKSIAISSNSIHRLANGQEAIDYLKKEGQFKNANHSLPILVLLDLKMPLKNGFDVLEEVKNTNNLKKIPIVMLTTTSNSEDIKKALNMGANDFIIKPLKLNDFTHKISKMGYYWGQVSDVKKIIT